MNKIKRALQKLKSRALKLTKNPNWETAFQSTDEYEVRINKIKLENEGIRVMIFDQRDSSYNTFGYIYINVQREDLIKAQEIIKE